MVGVADASNGRILLTCGKTERDSWLVLNARSLAIAHVDSNPCLAFDRIGSYWLEGGDFCTGHGSVVYLNWRTGQKGGEGLTDGDERTPFDLDTSALDAIGPRHVDFVTGAHAALPGGRRVALIAHSRVRQIARCHAPCEAVALKGGIALWTNGAGNIEGYALRTGKRFFWSLPEQPQVVGATTRRVYHMTGAGDLKSLRWRP